MQFFVVNKLSELKTDSVINSTVWFVMHRDGMDIFPRQMLQYLIDAHHVALC